VLYSLEFVQLVNCENHIKFVNHMEKRFSIMNNIIKYKNYLENTKNKKTFAIIIDSLKLKIQ